MESAKALKNAVLIIRRLLATNLSMAFMLGKNMIFDIPSIFSLAIAIAILCCGNMPLITFWLYTPNHLSCQLKIVISS